MISLNVKESFTEFLKNGRLKNISFGINQKELISLLGDTKIVIYHYEKDKYPGLLKYGKVEFLFDGGDDEAKLYCIMVQPVVEEDPPMNLEMIYGVWDEELTLDEATQYLEAHNIKYTKEIDKFDEDDILLKTKNGMSIHFSKDYKKEPYKYRFFELQCSNPNYGS